MIRGFDNQIAEFERIALGHLNAVYRAAVALSGRRSEAEDLVQKVYLKALERFGTFKSGTDCKSWLFQILRNTWIDELRHRKVVGPAVHADETIPAPVQRAEETTWSNASDLLENFSDEQVIKALAELPEDQRLTLFLVDVEQLSGEQVARIMKVAVGTVKSRAARARAILNDKLMAHAKDLGLTGRKR